MNRVTLEVARNLYPATHWHWCVKRNGKIVKLESYSNLVFCLVGALTVGVYSVLKTEKDYEKVM